MNAPSFDLAAAVNILLSALLGAGAAWFIGRGYYKSTARSIATAAQYLARLQTVDPQTVGELHFDDKGWLVGFDLHRIRPANALHDHTAGPTSVQQHEQVPEQVPPEEQ